MTQQTEYQVDFPTVVDLMFQDVPEDKVQGELASPRRLDDLIQVSIG
jgi:hypothetical protein